MQVEEVISDMLYVSEVMLMLRKDIIPQSSPYACSFGVR